MAAVPIPPADVVTVVSQCIGTRAGELFRDGEGAGYCPFKMNLKQQLLIPVIAPHAIAPLVFALHATQNIPARVKIYCIKIVELLLFREVTITNGVVGYPNNMFGMPVFLQAVLQNNGLPIPTDQEMADTWLQHFEPNAIAAITTGKMMYVLYRSVLYRDWLAVLSDAMGYIPDGETLARFIGWHHFPTATEMSAFLANDDYLLMHPDEIIPWLMLKTLTTTRSVGAGAVRSLW